MTILRATLRRPSLEERMLYRKQFAKIRRKSRTKSANDLYEFLSSLFTIEVL